MDSTVQRPEDPRKLREERCQLPTLVAGIRDARQVAVGGEFACALLVDSKIKCWGRNNFGQLGNGTTTNSADPVDVLDLPVDP